MAVSEQKLKSFSVLQYFKLWKFGPKRAESPLENYDLAKGPMSLGDTKRGGKPLVVFKQCFRCKKKKKKAKGRSIFKVNKMSQTKRIMEIGLILINANHHKRALGHRRKGAGMGQGRRRGRGMVEGWKGFGWIGRE